MWFITLKKFINRSVCQIWILFNATIWFWENKIFFALDVNGSLWRKAQKFLSLMLVYGEFESFWYNQTLTVTMQILMWNCMNSLSMSAAIVYVSSLLLLFLDQKISLCNRNNLWTFYFRFCAIFVTDDWRSRLGFLCQLSWYLYICAGDCIPLRDGWPKIWRQLIVTLDMWVHYGVVWISFALTFLFPKWILWTNFGARKLFRLSMCLTDYSP